MVYYGKVLEKREWYVDGARVYSSSDGRAISPRKLYPYINFLMHTAHQIHSFLSGNKFERKFWWSTKSMHERIWAVTLSNKGGIRFENFLCDRLKLNNMNTEYPQIFKNPWTPKMGKVETFDKIFIICVLLIYFPKIKQKVEWLSSKFEQVSNASSFNPMINLQGQVYHYIEALMPAAQVRTTFLTVYIFDIVIVIKNIYG